ncbi:MAG TPA: sugar phosphate isomerase/epimerase family protein [Chloroflexota bacterium]|jgi:sugar phosphate isomerase/epimerase|nr:sugar phosphate isomerase/epimerase family protein [Chloroflexota bacterium]
MTALKLGLVVSLTKGVGACLDKVVALGLPTCQVTVPASLALSDSLAIELELGARARGVEITTIWTHCRDGQIWNFVDGPATIGLVPAATRQAAVERLKEGSDFARRAGVGSVTTHAGFIPENPRDPVFAAVVEALRDVCAHCRANGQWLCLETGQETPVTLLRTIEEVGAVSAPDARPGLGVNLDPANLLMYGKANPVDALDLIGTHVRGVHAKDGEYPTNGRELGRERPLGEGRVDFPALIARLKGLGYAGALTIEREVRGPEQTAGVERAKRLLVPML